MPQIIDIVTSPQQAYQPQALEELLKENYGLGKAFSHYQLLKRSIDARGRTVKMQLKVALSNSSDSFQDNLWSKARLQNVTNNAPIHIVGAGPAGYFCALECIELGFKPIILERGKDVKARRIDLANINKKHIVNPDSNYCNGEGGAGTYSDGKLYTRSKKRGSVQKVLEILVAHGATPDILVDAHPHIGTNKLPKVIEDIRLSIEACGGEVHFGTNMIDLEVKGQKITSIITNQGKFDCQNVVLATGHSARGVYQLLEDNKIAIEAKPFALGVRVEHKQALIDQIQYKNPDRGMFLPAASYALVHNVSYQRSMQGVFSFCMCPGGFIVPAATENGEVVVNGMSPSKRDSKYSNSGIVVTVGDEDFKPFAKYGNLRGMAYQAAIEKRNFLLAGESQKASAQGLTDFVARKVSKQLPDTSYQPGLSSVDLNLVLPEKISTVLRVGFQEFGKKMRGYLTDEAVLVGVESRTSSPVKIPRNKETYQHTQICNLFPCAEGAGFAGGIVSAAIDGINIAEAINNLSK
jgi:uncharacterized protein